DGAGVGAHSRRHRLAPFKARLAPLSGSGSRARSLDDARARRTRSRLTRTIRVPSRGSANVQSSAPATEEMASTIGEIGRQVENSNQTARRRAAGQANR